MRDKFEEIIGMVYKRWKASRSQPSGGHPDEETIACFLEGKLSAEENKRLKEHLLTCQSCQELVVIGGKIQDTLNQQPPQGLVDYAKNLLGEIEKGLVLEIWLRLKEMALEIIKTTGDVLVGQELVPAPLLRSRRISEFKDEVTVLKDFKDIRLEVKIENKGGGIFNVIILAQEKQPKRTIKNLRITLIRDSQELESYLADSGKVIFEHILLGKYTIEIFNLEEKVASVALDIKK